ncbi:heme lyase CcmF/NrfE family subunit [Thalassolituus oleivorans]|uniref:heme lyase CcmF/NrfE family subunit n=1 Tax=Thalassolituus oleivorans TaxID=187493 RepID=UPI00240A4DC8|nr:heme lyase CcmF/NrfE family subunit [Thalassolituus oleivorans]MDF1641026.1 heme lyase CcmF/NrfE family subunit [Thalassolituus oleivorans]
MIVELGHLALIIALCIAICQATLPLAGSQYGIRSWIALARPLARLQLLFILISFASLIYAFLVHDFSVRYVASNSNTALPVLYLISGVWGAHEGSLLLWALILAVWTAAVTVFSRSIPDNMVARVIAVMGMISTGFLLFMLFTSNPFERLQFPPLEGRELNPLLQDPGLAIHPPMLYMGYVGFSVAFAFAIAAMLNGSLDSAWARWSRPWTTAAWVFLTVGIVMGSGWAYYELGWGGWWFWDPVENASLMPWLVGTALMHSLAVTDKRGAFKAWTVLLAIAAFSLSLLGTFLVRSGVLTSVHAFATDPARGVFILGFLIVVIGGSLLLYAWRASTVKSSVRFEPVSRDTGLLLNNVLLIVLAASILLGTLYPILIDALGLGKVSVGPPYFNSIFIPLAIPLAWAVGVGPFLRWRKDSGQRLAKILIVPLVGSVVIGTLATLLVPPYFTWGALLGLITASWVLCSLLALVIRQMSIRHLLRRFGRSQLGMLVAHAGIAVFAIGICLTSIYSSQKDIQLALDESYDLDGYLFTFKGAERFSGPNFNGFRGVIEVTEDGKMVAELHPEKRFYQTGMPMTEAGIDGGITRDLYVALGEETVGRRAWVLRIYHEPFVRWVWAGGMMMAFGGLLAVFDARYRRRRLAAAAVSATPVGVPA